MKPDRGSGNLHKLCPNLSWVVVVVGGGDFVQGMHFSQSKHALLLNLCVSFETIDCIYFP